MSPISYYSLLCRSGQASNCEPVFQNNAVQLILKIFSREISGIFYEYFKSMHKKWHADIDRTKNLTQIFRSK